MMSVVLDKRDYDVLNVVALKKMAAAATIADVCGLSVDEVESVLTHLAEHGLVAIAAGSALPTDTAEDALKANAAQYYEAVRTDPAIAELVTAFERINSQFLTTMSAWQQVEVGGRKVPNDHSDPAYDAKIIDRVEKLVRRLTPLIEALSAHDPRFSGYTRRFHTALEGIERGQHELVSSPTLDSVHNIWFEFHEDLLRTLGRERAE